MRSTPRALLITACLLSALAAPLDARPLPSPSAAPAPLPGPAPATVLSPVSAAAAAFVPAAVPEPVQDAAAAERQAVLARLAELELTITVDRDLAAAQATLDQLFGETGSARALLADADVTAARERLRGLLAVATGAEQSDLAQTLRDQMLRNNAPAILDLGEPALAELERMVRERPGDLRQVMPNGKPGVQGLDPLFVLALGRPTVALELILDLQRSGRPVHPLRIINAGLSGVIERDEHWQAIPGRSPRLTEPRWLTLVADRLADVAGSDEVLRTLVPTKWEEFAGAWQQISEMTPSSGLTSLVRMLYRQDAFTPDLIAALQKAAARFGAKGSELLAQPFESPSWGASMVPTALPLLEGLIGAPLAATRRTVAQRLSGYDVGPALLSMADDLDWKVREIVAAGLGKGAIQALHWDSAGRPNAVQEWRVPVLDSDAVAKLSQLLRDAEPAVRYRAVLSLASLDKAVLPDEEYLRLAGDENPAVREALVALQLSDTDLRVQILRRLAADSDPRVLKALDFKLLEAAKQTQLAPLLPVLVDRTLNPHYPLWSGSTWLSAESIASAAFRDMDVLETMLRLGLEQSNDELLNHAVRGFTGFSDRRQMLWTRFEPHMAAQVFARWVEWAWAPGEEVWRLQERDHASRWWRGSLPSEALPTLESLLEGPVLGADAGVDPHTVETVRFVAAMACAKLAFDEHREVLVEVLSSDGFAQWLLDPRQASWDARRLATELNDGGRNRLLLSMMREGLEDAAVVRLLEWYSMYDSFKGDATDELAMAICERWPMESARAYGDPIPLIVAAALRTLAKTPEMLPPETWIALAQQYATVAIAAQAMAESRNEQFTTVLADIIEAFGSYADFNPVGGIGDQARAVTFAIEGLTSRLSDEAAELLLDAAAQTSDTELREKCMEGVATIQEYQEARAAWDRRVASRATRDAAVQRLVAMLVAPQAEVRREAARGLGVLGAAEFIPDLILLLGDDDPDVAAAAREALDRLSQQPPVAPTDAERGGTEAEPPR